MSASFLTPPDDATTTQSLPPSPSSSPAAAILVIIIIAFSVVILASIHLLLRYLSDRFHRSARTFSVADEITPSAQNSSQPQRHVTSNNLPLFNFSSVKGNLTGADCAVCLSKFEPPDQLRLLPLCCHAFHAECIDTWIVSNGTCPLCRSPILASESNVLDKIPRAENRGSGSFRIEIGSVSRRQNIGVSAAEEVREPTQSSYSLGSVDYVMSGNEYEVLIGGVSAEDKELCIGIPIPEPPGEALTADAAGGRSWLRDYVDSLVSVSSFSSSLRSSGRFFSGSSRRTDSTVVPEDLEANRAGEEISELFRWVSGV